MTVVVGCTLVTEKLYTLPNWFYMINAIEGFDTDIFITFTKKGSFYHGDRTNWQMTADRNKLRDFALKYDADLLIVDSDTFAPPNTYIELNKVDADIVSAIVRNPIDFNVYLRDPDKDPKTGVPVRLQPVSPNAGPKECDAVGFGCVLIRNHILRKFNFTRDYNGITYRRAHDLIMCLKARDQEFKVRANTDIRCEHYGRHMNGWIDEPPVEIKERFWEMMNNGTIPTR